MFYVLQLTTVQGTQPHVIQFKTEMLQFRVSYNMNTFQSIHLNATSSPGIVELVTLCHKYNYTVTLCHKYNYTITLCHKYN